MTSPSTADPPPADPSSTDPSTAELATILRARRRVPFDGFARRRPFIYWFVVVVVSNLAGSVFNIVYNIELIVNRLMDDRQQAVFNNLALPLYNLIAYPVCLGVMIALIFPLARCRRRQQLGAAIPDAELEFCRRRLVNFPFIQVIINFLGWIPGAICFPALVCGLGGNHEAFEIWKRFGISFVISAVYATAQTFFLMEWFLVAVLYPDFFRDSRPGQVQGVVRIPFGVRMTGLWLAVGVMPLAAVTAIAYYGQPGREWPTVLVAGAGLLSGLLIFGVVRSDIGHWIAVHAAATAAVARENFAVRVEEQRPDEWGRLTDHFNDMAAALGRGQALRETFGQFVSPEVRDQIMERYPGLQVAVQEITVLFADIRGFTRRSAGEAPERIGALLNRFLTLTAAAIEEQGGYINKFLGDGVLALFGATHPDDRQADRALGCAVDLIARLGGLNEELTRAGQAPLVVGIGIHTGPALVGCFGAAWTGRDGRERIRREFSAVGETVNLGQRIEQMTKELGGPILLSEATRTRLGGDAALIDLGPHVLPGTTAAVRLFRKALAEH
ncbi:MAG: HAMP domain-containing protein [Gemmataceae bacterium]|nr:HAMP domain-containing protein [Gemmataceae bacterium]